jgi:SAM-dependent methyltransferase
MTATGVAEPVSPERIAAVARSSPLTEGGVMSELADHDELRFREEIEPIERPETHIPWWIEAKQLPRTLEHALCLARVEPHGTVVDLGAGTCWLGATLARRDEVERVISVEFSRRRIEEFAPVAIAYLDAPSHKIHRVVADFYAHGLGDAIADFVFTDAAFHHAADPARLARVAYALLKPGGTVMLHREPTLSLLHRTRPHGLEGEHGSFEHEYDARVYLRFLEQAGFDARKAPAPTSYDSRLDRARMRPPLSWLNGITFSMYTYIGVKR